MKHPNSAWDSGIMDAWPQMLPYSGQSWLALNATKILFIRPLRRRPYLVWQIHKGWTINHCWGLVSEKSVPDTPPPRPTMINGSSLSSSFSDRQNFWMYESLKRTLRRSFHMKFRQDSITSTYAHILTPSSSRSYSRMVRWVSILDLIMYIRSVPLKL